MIYVCSVCGYEYDEELKGVKFDYLDDDWVCPICKKTKEVFTKKPESTSTAYQNSLRGLGTTSTQPNFPNDYVEILPDDDETENETKNEVETETK